MNTFESILSAMLDAKFRVLNQRLEDIARRLPPQLATIAEAARVLKVSISTVRRRVKDGSLPAVHIGEGVIRVNLSGLNGPSETEVSRIVEGLRSVG